MKLGVSGKVRPDLLGGAHGGQEEVVVCKLQHHAQVVRVHARPGSFRQLLRRGQAAQHPLQEGPLPAPCMFDSFALLLN